MIPLNNVSHFRINLEAQSVDSRKFTVSSPPVQVETSSTVQTRRSIRTTRPQVAFPPASDNFRPPPRRQLKFSSRSSFLRAGDPLDPPASDWIRSWPEARRRSICHRVLGRSSSIPRLIIRESAAATDCPDFRSLFARCLLEECRRPGSLRRV